MKKTLAIVFAAMSVATFGCKKNADTATPEGEAKPAEGDKAAEGGDAEKPAEGTPAEGGDAAAAG